MSTNHPFNEHPLVLYAAVEGNRTSSNEPLKRAGASSYSKLLQRLAGSIAGNVPERADATYAAILGYN
ncbi:hypothetical protein AB4Y42_40475 [Paraburkholderia sp. EG286B]|uniref:hypothetical protein n=1 Tax=Paraburkholderia sp. EG286B TaxID=3237011 RepID=UPI0034D32396